MRRILLCLLSTCLLSIALLIAAFTGYQHTIAQMVQHESCVNIPATPNYLESGRPEDAIAAINYARQSEHLPTLSLPDNFYSLDATQEQFVLINLERTDRGLSPLKMNAVLSKMAQDYSQQMSQHHFFSHTSPMSGTFAQRLNSNPAIAHRYSFAAENLAGNPVAGIGPIYEYMYNDAQESCGHRQNILSPSLRQVGIGVVSDSTYGSISAQEFLAPLPGVTTPGTGGGIGNKNK
jgi:uncharacterized protein YkwD